MPPPRSAGSDPWESSCARLECRQWRPPRLPRSALPYAAWLLALYDSVSSRPLLYAFLGVGKAIILEDPSIECYAVDATILHLCKEFVDNANSLVIAFGAVPAREIGRASCRERVFQYV